MQIRVYQEKDRGHLKKITEVCFEGVSIEKNVEALLGRIGGKSWAWRKEREIDDDIAANPGGVFVAEADGRPIGFIQIIDPELEELLRILDQATDRLAESRRLYDMLLTGRQASRT